MMWGYRWDGLHLLGGWLMSAIMGLIMLALAVLAVIALVRLIRHTGRHAPQWQPGPPKQANQENSPLRILDERFARGEIDEEEYKRKKEILKNP